MSIIVVAHDEFKTLDLSNAIVFDIVDGRL